METGERLWIVAGKSQGSIRENSFGIDEMHDHLLDAPLAGRVAVQRFPLGDGTQEGEGSIDLFSQSDGQILALDQRDVARVVGQMFGSLRWLNHSLIITSVLHGTRPWFTWLEIMRVTTAMPQPSLL